jgi:hypothetical protein
MLKRLLGTGALLTLALILAGAIASAAEDVDTLARDVDRLESLRQVKDLQRSYAHYAQFGMWDEMADLFIRDARFIRGSEEVRGRAAIATWLKSRAGGRHGLAARGQAGRGLAPGALHTELIDEPLVNLSADGRSAKGRWMSLSMLGDGKGNARIEGGIYENEYVQDGQTWKICVAHYYPQFEGDYETGWANVGGGDLPLIPYHFSVDESGIPVPHPQGPAPRTGKTLAMLEQRIDLLNDEDAVRNLQHAYGYYVDRKMWDDVVDLFAEDAAVEVAGVGIFRGHKGVRQAMERMGPAGLKQGELNDRPLFDTIVQILPGGREAVSRGIELGMLGEADKGTANWEFTVFRNRFVKEGGIWKVRELRLFPLMKADYFTGWGKGGTASQQYDFKKLAATSLTGAIERPGSAISNATPAERLAEARRRLARSMAYDGTENVSSAYGYYIDDFQWPQMGAIFAEKGNKQSPFTGYYLGRERIAQAATVSWGAPSPTRPGISFHWRTQLVIHVASDGRSANLRTRLFQPRTGKKPSAPGAFYDAVFFSGMYPNDQAVIENGIWRLWSLTIDEPYFSSAGWKGGWSSVKPAPPTVPGVAAPPTALAVKFPPDVPMSQLGGRAEHFRGGTGETIEWPGILPMWFNYRNPVTGRIPEHYWPDCVICDLVPDSQMTRHGYLMPPTGPE